MYKLFTVPWIKGQSGNPGGRPRASEAVRLARERREEIQPEVVEALLVIARTAKDTRDRLAALKALQLDHPQPAVPGTQTQASDAVAGLTTDELVSIVRFARENEDKH